MPHITPDAKVADVIEAEPETIHVFLSYGCPDMRSGFFRMMSRLMSVRNAAKIHGLPLKELLTDLNDAVDQTRNPRETADL